jgi:protein-S-isoprenylcysteine O-methyltransferase Ste14
MSKHAATQEGDAGGTAGVIARPPVLFLAAGLLGYAADYLEPVTFPVRADEAIHGIIGYALILIGFTIGVAGIRDFSRAGTPVPTNQPTRALVTNGIHGWSRNPIYLGMFFIYGGIGVAARSVWIVILALPVAVAIRYGVVAREEAYLERRFGDAYLNYRARVRRWL